EGINKEEFCQQYKQQMGVDLDPARVADNPGLKNISKLILNNLWGKFSQRSNLPRVEYVKDVKRLWQILKNPQVDMDSLTLLELPQNQLEVRYALKDEFVTSPEFSNCYIAA